MCVFVCTCLFYVLTHAFRAALFWSYAVLLWCLCLFLCVSLCTTNLCVCMPPLCECVPPWNVCRLMCFYSIFICAFVSFACLSRSRMLMLRTKDFNLYNVWHAVFEFYSFVATGKTRPAPGKKHTKPFSAEKGDRLTVNVAAYTTGDNPITELTPVMQLFLFLLTQKQKHKCTRRVMPRRFVVLKTWPHAAILHALQTFTFLATIACIYIPWFSQQT
jgi:hypothetical protein